jgi:hypothetical protein
MRLLGDAILVAILLLRREREWARPQLVVFASVYFQ